MCTKKIFCINMIAPRVIGETLQNFIMILNFTKLYELVAKTGESGHVET